MSSEKILLKNLPKIAAKALVTAIPLCLIASASQITLILMYSAKNIAILFPIIFFPLLAFIYIKVLREKDYVRKEKKVFKNIYKCTLTLALIYLILLFSIILSIEIDYYTTVNNYREYLYERKGIDAIWSIINDYSREFKGAYGLKTLLIPSREIASRPLCHPVLFIYCLTGGYKKLVVVQRIGACGEFAQAIVYLLGDLGVKTRKISIEGIDHGFSEAYVNGEWWVLDKVYTTQVKPVKAKEYALHLKKLGIFKYVSRLVDLETGLDVASEHGFNTTVLVIVAISDLTTKPDEKPVEGATVEVFALENYYDPLVARGITNKSGVYTVTLVSNKEYIIIAKKGNMIGLAKVKVHFCPCIKIEVRMHKYG